ncbi:MAG: hypothetical protein MJ006_02190 [Methanocorpusculum sp.]|nr:hypothetical protein [Methanocorpusculum sp.]
MIVTSSRKPSVEIRRLAKEIAFALGVAYVQRGKAGLRTIEEVDSSIIFVSDTKRMGPVVDITRNGNTVFSMLITNIIPSERTGAFYKGFLTREPDLYKLLSPYVPITLDLNAEGAICFCGMQKMQYRLQVMV